MRVPLQRHEREDELKASLAPCPHCGAKAELRMIEQYDHVLGRRAFYRPQCSEGCTIESRVDLADATARWNRRERMTAR